MEHSYNQRSKQINESFDHAKKKLAIIKTEE